MNERIRELALQAGMRFDRFGMVIPTTLAVQETVNLEKFAELIVEECLNKIEQAGTYFNAQPQYTDAQNKLVDEGFTWGVESCQAMVKQHFGVKE